MYNLPTPVPWTMYQTWIELPQPFHVNKEEVIHRVHYDDYIVRIVALPHFLVRVEITTADGRAFAETFNPIYGKRQHIAFKWNQVSEYILVVDKQLVEPGSADPTILMIAQPAEPEDPTLSFDHVDADTSCASWVAKRKVDLLRWEAARPDRQNIDVSAFEYQLDLAVTAIRSDLKAIEETEILGQDRNLHFHKLAEAIRALVHWNDRPNTTYSPLLLRVAARYDLSLPVFVLKPLNLPVDDDRNYHSMKALVSFTRYYPNMVLEDVQEWLETIIVTGYVRNPSSNTQTPVNASVRDILHTASNIFGGSHYSSDVPHWLESVSKTQPAFLFDVIQQAAIVCCVMGDYVLHKTGYRTGPLIAMEFLGNSTFVNSLQTSSSL